MVIIVIVGAVSCPFYAHCRYIAQYLHDNLPEFNFNAIAKDLSEWHTWLEKTNETWGWHHTESPIVWREIAMRGGKHHYIGGINEFWEYVYDYYGLEYILPKNKLDKLVADNVQYFNAHKVQTNEEHSMENKKIRKICICEANQHMLALLIPELIKLLDFHCEDGLAIYIWNRSSNYTEFEDEPDLYDQSDTYHIYVEVIDNLEDYIQLFDLVLICDDFPKFHGNILDWIEMLYNHLEYYADVIDNYGKKNIRVIVVSSPTCLCASMLVHCMTRVRIHNIVALTADLGLEALGTVAQKASVPITHLSCPPVYGFVGINQLIDIGNIIERTVIPKPNLRALRRTKENTTLPLGEEVIVLRPLQYLTINLKNIWHEIHMKKVQAEKALGRSFAYGKVRSIIDLLRCWYTKYPDGEIISLGVYTIGHFGIKKGLVFSQPVSLEHGVWRPFTEFPRPDDPCRIEDLVLLAEKMMDHVDSILCLPVSNLSSLTEFFSAFRFSSDHSI